MEKFHRSLSRIDGGYREEGGGGEGRARPKDKDRDYGRHRRDRRFYVGAKKRRGDPCAESKRHASWELSLLRALSLERDCLVIDTIRRILVAVSPIEEEKPWNAADPYAENPYKLRRAHAREMSERRTADPRHLSTTAALSGDQFFIESFRPS